LYEGVVQDLIDELGRLPGVGPKSAQRIAFHLLAADPADIGRLQEVLGKVKEGVQFCEICGNVSEQTECRICRDTRRDLTVICVVEEPKDVLAVERTREFKGRYHVLGGALDPLSGIGPEQLRMRQLLARIGGAEISEIIIATDPNTEGEATATYLVRMLRGFPGLSITRLASGLPMGGDLEFADELTLGRALSGRRAM
jgi:recombination protein RecR